MIECDEYTSVTYRFRVIDQDALDTWVDTLLTLNRGALDLGEAPTNEDKIEALITDLDVLGMEHSRTFGWNEFGLERVG